MDFTPSQDELLIRDAARELAAKEIAPKAAHFDETMIFPQENVKKLAELGFLGMCVTVIYMARGLKKVDEHLFFRGCAPGEMFVFCAPPGRARKSAGRSDALHISGALQPD